MPSVLQALKRVKAVSQIVGAQGADAAVRSTTPCLRLKCDIAPLPFSDFSLSLDRSNYGFFKCWLGTTKSNSTPEKLPPRSLVVQTKTRHCEIKSRQMATNGEPLVCGLDGNPDLTGLGIRAAFYIQTLSFAIAGEFLDAEAGYLHSSAIGLLLAVFVALLRETVSGSLSAPEVAVVMWLFSLQLFASGRTVRKTVPDGEKRVSTAAFLTLRLHILLVLAYIGYATWFWFVGLDVLPHTACTEWAFFFSKVDVRGWFRTLSKVVMGMVCSICGLWVLIMLTIWTFVLLSECLLLSLNIRCCLTTIT